MDILEQARILGMALADSKEMIEWDEAQAMILTDDNALKTIAKNTEAKKMLSAFASDETKLDLLKDATETLEETDEYIKNSAVIQNYLKAQKAINKLFSDVNGAITHFAKLDTDKKSGSGCNGCSGCGK